MEITSGKIAGPLKVVIYGPEGIGKTTFAAQFPSPLFIDTEGSTKDLDVRRLPNPATWTMLLQEVDYVRQNPHLCGTLIIDTADWAEKLAIKHIVETKLVNKQGEAAKGIEDFGYGKGYTYLMEEYGRLLNLLSMVIEQGIGIVLTAHAAMRKFEQPDEMGSYDRWELKLEKKVAPIVKEWADMVLFANYKTYVVNVDNQGAAKGKNKAQGGQRVMYTSHHPAWDAKNRKGLPDELPFNFDSITHVIPGGVNHAEAPISEAERLEAIARRYEAETANTASNPPAIDMPLMQQAETTPAPASEAMTRPEGIPDALWQLMQTAGISDVHLRYAVYKRGYYPFETPISNYDQTFINGVLIGAWPQVKDLAIKHKDEIPF